MRTRAQSSPLLTVRCMVVTRSGAPVLNPAPRKPYQELVSDAKSFDKSLRVRPSGRGALVTKIFKWG